MLRKGNQRITTTYSSEKKLNRPILFKNYRDNLKQIFKLPHSIVVESYVKAFQYKVIYSILYTNTKLYKIGFRTNDLCTFCDNQPESLTHFSITAHALNSFGLNLNYIGALFRINEFVSAWKICSLEF